MSNSEIGGAPRAIESKSGGKKPSFIARIMLFIRQVIDELKKVVAPTRKELINYFFVVLGFVVIMMIFVWLIDQLFGWLAVLVFGSPLT